MKTHLHFHSVAFRIIFCFLINSLDFSQDINYQDDIMLIKNPPSFKASQNDFGGIGDAMRIWHLTTQEYNGPGLAIAVMADQNTCSWGNAGMNDLSSEPRKQFDNSPYYGYQNIIENYWTKLYTVLDTVNSVLIRIDNGTLDFGSTEENIKVESWAYLMQGLVHGYLALVFDQAYIIDETTDQESLILQPYPTVISSAIGYLNKAAALANENTFDIPSEWLPGAPINNTDVVKFANSFAARLLVYSSRNTDQNIAVDWTQVLNYANNGIENSFAPFLDDVYWYDLLKTYSIYPGWTRADHRIINLMDPNYPARWPLDGVFPDPQEATSNDLRLSNYFEYLSYTAFRPERGFYHFSHYRLKRDDEYLQTWTGEYPTFKVEENNLIIAEALLRTDNKIGAINIINEGTRTIQGGLPPLLESATFDEVLEAIFYERDIELMVTGMGIAWFDMRRRDALQKGTLLNFPVPANVLIEAGVDNYTFGGEPSADGINTALGLNSWDDAFYASVAKASCDNTASDWTITIEATGDQGPYQYSIDGAATFQTESLFSNLSDGTYFYTIKDINNIVSETKILYVNSINVTPTIINDCYDADNDGIIRLDVSGGIEPYSFSWSNGETTKDIYKLDNGQYTVTITEANGCAQDYSFEIITLPGFNTGSIAGLDNTVVNQITQYTTSGYVDSYFSWYIPGAEILGTNQGNDTITVKWISEGEFEISVVENGYGCSGEPVLFNVIATGETGGIEEAMKIWHQTTQEYNGPGLAIAVMADQNTCSWGNAGMRDLSSEPRMQFDNSVYYAYQNIIDNYWGKMYSVLDTVNNVLTQLNNETLFYGSEELNIRAESWAYLMQGLVHGYLALVFDQAYIIDETTDHENLSLQPYSAVISAAIGYLNKAAALANANTFDIPSEWLPGAPINNTDIVKFANSFAARLLVYSSRNADQNTAIDWTQVLDYANNGIENSFAPLLDDVNWYDLLKTYSIYGGWTRADHRIINLMDPNYPARWPLDGVFPDPQEATSNDLRLTNYFEYLPDNNFLEERGFYHFSHYRLKRDDEYLSTWTGEYPTFKVEENNLIIAEALLRTDNKTDAINIINQGTRTTQGGLPPLLESATFDEVLEAIFYERDIELMVTGMGIAWFDMRRRDALQKGTLLNFPVPANVLINAGVDVYTYGGEPYADGINTALGLNSWDDGFYAVVEKSSCDPAVSDWSVFIEATGNQGPYQYSIDSALTFQAESSFINLSAGTYYYAVKDYNNVISEIKTLTIESLLVEANIRNNCFGSENDGSLELNISRGIEPLSFNWSNGEITKNIYNLYDGSYQVSVTQANGCAISYNYDIVTFPEIITGEIDGLNYTTINQITQYTTSGLEDNWFQWSIPGGLIVEGQGNDTITVKWIDEGHFEISVIENGNGCSGESVLFDVLVIDDSFSDVAPPTNLTVTDLGFASWEAPVSMNFSDDFESYDIGGFLADQSDEWATWLDNPNLDAPITDEQALSGTKSIKLEGEGTSDMILDFGILTSGHFQQSLNIYVEPENGAYFNLLHNFDPIYFEYAIIVYFASDGTATIEADNSTIAFTYQPGTWNNCLTDIDLDNDLATFYVNGNQVYSWQWSHKIDGTPGLCALEALNLWSHAPSGTNPLYYIDDVSIEFMSPLEGYNVYLDSDSIAFAPELFWQYSDLIPGTIYTAGVSAIYGENEFESPILEQGFTFTPSYNIGISALNTPIIPSPSGSLCNLTANEQISIKVFNSGLNPISNFDIGYSIDGDTPIVETYLETLNPGDTIVYTFAATADLYTNEYYRTYAFDFFVQSEDDYPNDNEKIVSLKVHGDYTDMPGWTTYNSCDGVLSDISWAIAEDKNGHIWSTDFYGASKFDGTTWSTYTVEDGLGENYNWAMINDKDGNIWFAGDTTITKFDGSGFTIHNNINGHFEECIYQDSNGNIWLGSYSGDGILKFDGTDWIHFPHSVGISGQMVLSIGEDINGNIYASSNLGLNIFDGNSWTNFIIPNNTEAYISEIFYDSEGNTWFSPYVNGFYKYDGANWSHYSIEDGAIDYCEDITEDIYGNIWFGGGNEIVKYDGASWTKYTIEDGLISASAGSIYAIYADSRGDIWTGTYRGGISKLEQEPPPNVDWTVNPADFAFEGEITAEVFLDSIAAGPGILGAFVNDTCRGVMGEPLSLNSKLVYIMRIYSNEASGEEISFKFFYPDMLKQVALDPEDLPIFDIRERITFESDMTIGDALNPFEMNAYSYSEYLKQMTSGWNWFSVYLINEDMTLDTILSSLNPEAGDYIKDRKGTGNSATFYDQDGFRGWFGTLLELDPIETYKMNLNNAGDLIYYGYPIDIANAEIPVFAGWNWIGYPVSFEMLVEDYLASLDIVDGDYIKDQLVSTTYYEGYGWFGQLEMMQPTNGYVLRVANSGSINETPDNEFKATTLTTNEGAKIDIPKYKVNVHDFEFSASATIEVFLDDINIGAENNILYAFNKQDECVGIINGLLYPMTDKYLYNLMLYSNIKEGDEVHFKFFQKDENKWYTYEETLSFNEDMVIADVFHPFELKNAIADELNLDAVELYPNPFTDKLSIKFTINKTQNIRIAIYDGYGKLIELLIDKTSYNPGTYLLEWNTYDIPVGIYYIRIEKQESVDNLKVLKVK
jgi:IS1 family transposase